MATPPPPPIEGHHPSSRPVHHVLFIIDAQVNMLQNPPHGVPSSATMRANILRILAEARRAEPPPLIVHIRNNGDPGDPDEEGTPGWQLIYDPLPGEPVINKNKNNAFAGTRLGDVVSCEAEIVVIGMQSDFCIRATCSAALGRGNEVLMIRGCHATYDRVDPSDGGFITPASKIEAEVEAELEEAGVMLFDMKDIPGIFSDREP